MGMGGQRNALTAFPPRNKRSPCIWGWVGPKADWTATDNLAPIGIGSSDVQQVVSRYTD